MLIGIDCRLPYYRMGGISRYALHLLPALAKIDRQNRYLILQSRKEKREYGHLFAGSPENFATARLWTPCHHRLERWSLAAELLPHRLDVLHSPDFIPPAGGARRYVITVHDLNFLYYPQYLTADSLRYYSGQIGRALDKADAVAADSEHTRQDLIELLDAPPEKIFTIPLAAGPAYAEPVPTNEVESVLAKHRLPRDFLLFVGTLEPRKNIPLLLELLTRLRPQLDLTLVMVGSKGWIHDDIFASITEKGLDDRVFHLEGISDRELAALYRAASLLALPSFYEGFGFPALEAMHCGCPVISSDRGSLPEVVGEAGLLLDPDDPQAWQAGLTEVLSNSSRRAAMIEAGYRQAARFTWEKTATKTLALYNGV